MVSSKKKRDQNYAEHIKAWNKAKNPASQRTASRAYAKKCNPTAKRAANRAYAKNIYLVLKKEYSRKSYLTTKRGLPAGHILKKGNLANPTPKRASSQAQSKACYQVDPITKRTANSAYHLQSYSKNVRRILARSKKYHAMHRDRLCANNTN